MEIVYRAIIAFSPIALAFALTAGFRLPAAAATSAAWLVCVAAGAMYWQMPADLLAASTLLGFANACKLLLIVFGAVLVLFTLRESGGLAAINRGFADISSDRRVQTIIIAFAFATFMEGASGFGTPAAVAAPLLLGLGFPAMAAAVVCLLFNSFSVSFGAMGTPINFGLQVMARTLAEGSGIADRATMDAYFATIAEWSVLLHLPMLFLLPLITLAMLSRFFGPERSWLKGLGAWKFSLFASTVFAAPYALSAKHLGEEFPALTGGLACLVATVAAARLNVLTPKTTWEFDKDPKTLEQWSGDIEPGKACVMQACMRKRRAWLPYALIGGLLVITRMDVLPFKSAFYGFAFHLSDMFGYPEVDFVFRPLYSPGVMPFLFVSLLTIYLHRMRPKQVARAWIDSLRIMRGPAVALFFAVALAEIMNQSGVNNGGLPSMPVAMTEAATYAARDFWPLLSPFIGALGAFFSGSNTVSNMLFAEFHYDAARQLSLGHELIVALHSAGGAVGNMVCFHNVVAVAATVGLAAREGRILRYTTLPLALYCLALGLFGMLLS